LVEVEGARAPVPHSWRRHCPERQVPEVPNWLEYCPCHQ